MKQHCGWQRLLSPALALAGPALLWAILFVALPPAHQDFPLNDDWSFARGAFAFARGEGIHYFGWASMPLIGQWLWAYPFVRLLGESHAILRLSTLLLSWIGILAFFYLLRQAAVPAGRATFAAAVLALNPLFFLMAGTYMSDVPALSLSLASLALYGGALRNRRAAQMAAGAAVAVLAALTRQNTLAVPLTAGVLLWGCPDLRNRPGWMLAIVAPIAVGAAVSVWFGGRADIVRLMPRVPGAARSALFVFSALHLLGLSTIPLLALGPQKGSRRGMAIALAVLALAAAGFAMRGRIFPYLPNMLTPWGQFGVNDVVVGSRPVLMGSGVRIALTLGGCLSGAALLVAWANRLRGGLRADPLLLFTALHLAFLTVSWHLSDRYLLVLIPGAVYVIAAGARGTPARWGIALAALALFGVLSAGLMHDWLAWNSARWQVGRRALARGISPSDIEGGFEWDGWHSPAPPRQGPLLSPWRLMLPFTGSLFPHVTGRFALAFSAPPGTRIVDAEPYTLWLLPGRREFLLVRME